MAESDHFPAGGITFVLGGGGRVGMAYQAGVLRALRDVGSYDARKADHIIGTSAGAVTGAYLALNRRPEQVARLTYNPTPPNATRQVSSDFNMVRAWSSRT